MFETKPRISYFGQFGVLIGLIGAGLILAVVIQLFFALSMMNFTDMMSGDSKKMIQIFSLPENVNKVRWMQMLGTFAMMFLPAFFFALIIGGKPKNYLGLSQKTSLQQVFIVVGIAITALFLSGSLGELNKIIPIPSNWAIKFKAMEDSYNEQVMMLSHMNSFFDYIISLVMIAILPAVFEELLFRGCIQQLFIGWFKKPHVAIFVTSFIFSIIHFSYYGFLPRLALGLILGYLFYFSKSIWLNILMHFINNGIAITVLYFTTAKGLSAKDALEDSYPIWLGIITLSILIYLFKLFIEACDKLENHPSNHDFNIE